MDTIISIPGSADLLEQVDFSYPTLCRDLNELERENKIVRFHGGVRYADENINALTPHPFACSDYYLYQTRQKLNLPEKQAIGRTAASLVQNNNIVFISHGTTTVELVKALASSRGQALSRESLMKQVWNFEGFVGDVRAVDVAIRRLREKLEDDPADPKFIITRRGLGYAFGKSAEPA